MEIIKGGFTSPAWTTDIVCEVKYGKGCGSTLRVNQGDLFTVFMHDIAGARNEAKCVCPYCGASLTIADILTLIVDIPDRKTWETAHPRETAAAVENAKKFDELRKVAKAKYSNDED